ncbi:MAG: hypothetical protein IJV69_03930 [Kiritimatiellae bacterium]|nr:hypothetical protein [Kiritimatiellia bacterium]
MDDTTQKRYEDRDMSGALFANEYKGEHDHKLPSARGTVMVAGKKYHVAAWTRFNSVTGKKYLSLKLEEYETWAKEREAAKAQKPAPASVKDVGDDEDLPF